MPVSIAQSHIASKGERIYTSLSSDIHERDAKYLKQVVKQYSWLASHEEHWVKIECLEMSGRNKEPQRILKAILAVLENLIPPAQKNNGNFNELPS